MELGLLKLFVDVTNQGSFAAVARTRAADPSTVSRAISALEDELGVRLFHRTTRRLSLTEAGQLYLARVEPLVMELDAAQEMAQDISAAPAGKLRVTTSATCGQRLITPLLKEFRELYPALLIDLLLSDSYIDLVAERIDVAVRLGPRLDNGFVGTKLTSVRYLVCASPDYVRQFGALKKPQELSERDCVLFDLPDYRSSWLFRDEAGNDTKVAVHGGVVISNVEAIRQCVLNGMGPALLADWLVKEDMAEGKLVDLFPDHRVTATDFETAVWVLYPSRTYLPQKARVFVDFLKAKLRDHL